MCGIAGILRFDGAPVDRTVLGRVAGLLARRAPDGEGTFAPLLEPEAVHRVIRAFYAEEAGIFVTVVSLGACVAAVVGAAR